MLTHLSQRLNGLPPWSIFMVGLFFTCIISIIDSIIPQLSLEFLYFGPIIFVTWYASRKAGYVLSLISSVSIILVDYSVHFGQLHPIYLASGLLFKIMTFLLVIHLLCHIKQDLAINKSLAHIDALTGISNRLTFTEYLETLFILTGRNNEPFTLAYVDIDNFKHINDTYGHGEGDNVLCQVSNVLRATLRRSDMAARLGGDEFAMLLPNTDSIGAKNLIDKIATKLQETFLSRPSPITCSIGAVTFEALPKTVSDAIKIADELMYEVKKDHKNAVRYSLFKVD